MELLLTCGSVRAQRRFVRAGLATPRLVAFSVPMGYYNGSDWVDVPGYEVPHGAASPFAGLNCVTPDYFHTMGIPFLEGRDFTKADDQNSTWVAIVNETMAQKFWPNESAIGHEFRIASDHVHSLHVVGVVKNSRTLGMLGPIREYFYQPFAQNYSSLAVLQVRTTSAPETMTAPSARRLRLSLPRCRRSTFTLCCKTCTR